MSLRHPDASRDFYALRIPAKCARLTLHHHQPKPKGSCSTLFEEKMGLSDDGEDNAEARYEDLCMDLNLDKTAKEEAWQAYETIQTNYTLEVS